MHWLSTHNLESPVHTNPSPRLRTLAVHPSGKGVEALSEQNTPSKSPLANRLYRLIFSSDKRLGTRRRVKERGRATLRRGAEEAGDEKSNFFNRLQLNYGCVLLYSWPTDIYTLPPFLPSSSLPQCLAGGTSHQTMGPFSPRVTQRSTLARLTAPGWSRLLMASASKSTSPCCRSTGHTISSLFGEKRLLPGTLECNILRNTVYIMILDR